ncbi:MAG: DoxX family protein [Bacteroidota bacterium]
MKKLLSTKYSAGAFNAAMLVLRLGVGVLMMNHGYDKLVHFGSRHNKFMNFLGMGSSISLALVIFAEFFCSLFIILGLFTRLAVIPLIIVMGVALFKAHNAQFFGDGEMAAVYLAGYITLLLLGPGRVSVDSMVGK